MISYEADLTDATARAALVSWMSEHLPSDIVDSVTEGGYSSVGNVSQAVTITLKTDVTVSDAKYKQIMCFPTRRTLGYKIFNSNTFFNSSPSQGVAFLASNTMVCKVMSSGTFLICWKVDSAYSPTYDQGYDQGALFFGIAIGKLSDGSIGLLTFGIPTSVLQSGPGKTFSDTSSSAGPYMTGNYMVEAPNGTGGNVGIVNTWSGYVGAKKLIISATPNVYTAIQDNICIRYSPNPSHTAAANKTAIYNCPLPDEADNIYFTDIYVSVTTETLACEVVTLNDVDYFSWYGIVFFKV
jgi:hypothetical protein